MTNGLVDATAESTGAQPWHGREVPWIIDGIEHIAHYNPAELAMMAIAKERGATRRELEFLHLVKACLGGVIVDAEASA